MKDRAPKFMNGMTIFAALAVLTDPADAQKIPAPHTGALRWPVVRHGGQSSFRALGNVKDNVRYSLTVIGVLAGEQSSFLPISGSVDSSGVLAGFSYNSEFGASVDFFTTAVGFTWKDGVPQPLPLLGDCPGAFAFGLNNNGQVYGTANNADNFQHLPTPMLARPMASTITDRSSDSRGVSAAHRPARGQPIQFSGHRKHKAT